MKNVFYDILNDEYVYTEYNLDGSDFVKIDGAIELDIFSFELLLNENGFNEVEFEKYFGLLLYDSLNSKIKEICIEKNNKIERLDDEIDNELTTNCKSFIGWKRNHVIWRTDDARAHGFFYLRKDAQPNEVEEIKNEIYSIIKSEIQSYISAQVIIWDAFKTFAK